MISDNDDIYNIFRKDLHLSEEKTRKLVSNMNTAVEKAQASHFATKAELQDFSIKMGQVISLQDTMKENLKEVKNELKEFKNEMKDFKDEMRDFKDEVRDFKDEVNTKMGDFKNKMNEVQIGLATFQVAVITQMKTDAEKIYSKMSTTGLLQYIAITGTILSIIATWAFLKF